MQNRLKCKTAKITSVQQPFERGKTACVLSYIAYRRLHYFVVFVVKAVLGAGRLPYGHGRQLTLTARHLISRRFTTLRQSLLQRRSLLRQRNLEICNWGWQQILGVR